MKNQKINFIALFVISLFAMNCKKQEVTKTIIVEGVVRDNISNAPVAGIGISIDAIKSPTSMGISASGRRENAEKLVTDNNGYYYAKLKVFQDAETLEFNFNQFPYVSTIGYERMSRDLEIVNLKPSESNNIDFLISPMTVLKIEFKNTNPQNDSDRFSCIIPGNLINIENCGSINPTEALSWVGRNVCGIYNCETYAEKLTRVFWSYRENGISYNRIDSMLTKRNVINVIQLEY